MAARGWGGGWTRVEQGEHKNHRRSRAALCRENIADQRRPLIEQSSRVREKRGSRNRATKDPRGAREKWFERCGRWRPRPIRLNDLSDKSFTSHAAAAAAASAGDRRVASSGAVRTRLYGLRAHE